MRRKLLFFIVAVAVGLMVLPLTLQAEQTTKGIFRVGQKSYTIDNVTYSMDVAPFIENGRVYVPVRYLAHMLSLPGDGVIWDASSQSVFMGKEGIAIRLQVGNAILQRSPGTFISMDVAPVIRNNRVFLPARYVAEQFGFQVEWLSQTQEVFITRGTSSLIQPQIPASTSDNKAVSKEKEEAFIEPYQWKYKGGTWTWAPQIPQDMADSTIQYYRNNKPHPHRTEYDYLLTYCMDKESLKVLSTVAEVMKAGAIKNGFSEKEIPYIVIAFVQSFEYVSDSISSGYDEYPRYPLETLLERKGDCEDTAILTAVLLRQLGYGSALIFFDDHCAVGVKGDRSLEGYYYEVNNTRYYYLETTDTGWKVGQMPEKLKNKKALVLPLP